MIFIFSPTQKRAFRLSQNVVKLNTQIDITEANRQDALVEKNSVSVFFHDAELKELHAKRQIALEQLKSLTITN